MNLLSILTSALTSGSALQALSAKTGLSEKQLKLILAIAIPLLLKKMTSNASNQSGANSLLGALAQHQGTKSVEDQLNEADTEDGAKIVGHIFGDDQDNLVNSVAEEAGVESDQVRGVLDIISPTVLNGLSAATQSAQTQQASGVNLADGIDLGDILGLLGGASAAPAQQVQQPSGGGLLASLFGGAAPQPVQQSAGGGLLASLFGGAAQPEQDHSVNGTQLINTLLSLMK